MAWCVAGLGREISCEMAPSIETNPPTMLVPPRSTPIVTGELKRSPGLEKT